MQKRTLYLVGDSVTHQQFLLIRHNVRSKFGKEWSEYKIKGGLGECGSVKGFDFKLCFVQCGRLGGRQVLSPNFCKRLEGKDFWNLNLGDTLTCMRELKWLTDRD